MYDEIKKVIDYIEEHYKEGIDSNTIEDITRVNYSKFSLVFKEVSGIKFEKYRKKRCLTKIITEIKTNNDVIKNNISPYSSPQAFNEAFKNEFYISPRKFLYRQNENLLCEKLDIDRLYDEHKNNEIILEELIKEYLGHKKCALNFLLSLNAYSITNLDENFSHQLGIGYKLLNRRYLDEEGEFISLKSISVDRYLEEIKIFTKYYDVNTCLQFPYINELKILSTRKYYMVKKSIINKLINSYDLISILNVVKLKTIFLHFTNMNKFSALSEIEDIINYKYYYQNEEKHLLNKSERLVLKYICLQDIGIKEYKKIDDLITSMKMDINLDGKSVEKIIIKLIKKGLLYLDENDDFDYELNLRKYILKEEKKYFKKIEKQEKIFLKQLKKIKKYIISIKIEGEMTKVKYNYKALEFISTENIIYGFRYITETTEASYNIYSGLIMNKDYLELHFKLSDGGWKELDGKVKDDFKKKILEIIKLINKGYEDEE